MSIPIIDTLKPLGNFPVVNSGDVDVNGVRLDDALQGKANTEYVNAELKSKADTSSVSALQKSINDKADSNTVAKLSDRVSETETKTNNLQSQIDSIVIESGGDSNLEVVQARVDATGKEYGSLKSRIDGDVTLLRSDLNLFKSGDWSDLIDMEKYQLIRGMEITVNSVDRKSIDFITSSEWSGASYSFSVVPNTSYQLIFDVNKPANYSIDITNEAQDTVIVNCGTPSVGNNYTYTFNSGNNNVVCIRFASSSARDNIKISNARIRTTNNNFVDNTLTIPGKSADANVVGKKIANSVGNNSAIEFEAVTHPSYGFIQQDIDISGEAGDVLYVGINKITGDINFVEMAVYFYTADFSQAATIRRIGEVIEITAPDSFSLVRLFINSTSMSAKATINAICCKKNPDNFITANNNRIDDTLLFVANSVRAIQDINMSTANVVTAQYNFAIPEIIPSGAVVRVSMPVTNPFNYTALIISADKILLDKIPMPVPKNGNYSVIYINTSDYGDNIMIGMMKDAGTPLHFRNYDTTDEMIASGYKMHKATQITNSSLNKNTKVQFSVSDVYQSYQIGIEYVAFGYHGAKSSSSLITVGKTGCDFVSINDAINSIIDDSIDKPYTIMIYPGIYDEVVDVRGLRHISLIGINRDKCIIRDTSGQYYNSPVRIAGDFVVENLTIIANADNAEPNWTPTGWNPETNYLDYPSYAIHIDDADNTDEMVYGRIRNCTLYSECFHAIGCGMHSNQTLEIENCKIIRNTKRSDFLDNDYQGAMGIHSTLESDDVNQFVSIKNCEISYNHDKAVQLQHYYPTSPMKVTFIGCTLSDANGTSNLVYYKGTDTTKEHYIGSLSHGNNTNELNS